MFLRRLLLLTAGVLMVSFILCAQMLRLTVAQASDRKERAEAALVERHYIPTSRGAILDVRGLRLAEDMPGWDISVSFDVMTGEWAFKQAMEDARAKNAAQWNELDAYARERLARPFIPQYEQQINEMWMMLSDLGQGDLEELLERRTDIVKWVKNQASHIWEAWRRQKANELNEEVSLADVAAPIHEQTIAHAVMYGVDDRAKSRIESFIAEAKDNASLKVWQEVNVARATRRHYSSPVYEVVLDRSTLPSPLRSDKPMTVNVQWPALHIVGAMRGVWKEDISGEEGRPFRFTNDQGELEVDLGGYMPGDRVGRSGVELSQEKWLRGLRGQVTTRLDLTTNNKQTLDPQKGKDVVLSVDMRLQARIAALLDPRFGLMVRQPWHAKELSGPAGQELFGSVVVMDVARAEILAAVTTPSFSREQLRTGDPALLDPERLPLLNRAVARSYEPGSTVKPQVLAAAITDGEIGVHGTVDCQGKLFPDKPKPRCWIYKHYNGLTHGPLTGDHAICESCNIYFYTMGMRLGSHRLVEWYENFGLGSRTNCGLPEEIDGYLPDRIAAKEDRNTPGFTQGDAIYMGIGQGPIGWTPVQAAAAYATLARGGYYVSPTFIAKGDPEFVQETRDLRLNPAGVELALKGLYMAANTAKGTAHHILIDGERENTFNIEGIEIYAKSGTADASPLKEAIDDDGDGYPDRYGKVLRDGDHAWVVALVKRPGSPRADYVVVVVVEYAGSGGRVSGPIVNQVLHAMRAEGVL